MSITFINNNEPYETLWEGNTEGVSLPHVKDLVLFNDNQYRIVSRTFDYDNSSINCVVDEVFLPRLDNLLETCDEEGNVISRISFRDIGDSENKIEGEQMKITDVSIIVSVNEEHSHLFNSVEDSQALDLSFVDGVSFNDGQDKEAMIDLFDKAIQHLNLLKAKIIGGE